MENKTSRIMLLIQAVVLCLPLTYLYIFRVIPAELYFLGNDPFESPVITVMVSIVIMAGLVSGWRLIIAFVFYGRDKLSTLPIFWWLIAGTLAVLSITSFIHSSITTELNPSSFNSLGWGIFFVIPFIHLLFERYRANSTSN
jgi:RsiW-degrading membrane proteinase PrsW (M82 family)